MTVKKSASGRKTTLRVVSLLLCALMFAGVLSSCKGTKKNSDETTAETEGFVFSGEAYTADGVSDLPEALSSVSVTANNDRSAVIPVNSTFTIKTAGKTNVETLSQYLTVKPAVAFTVSAKSETEFLLTPETGSLDAGKVYSFTVGDPENPTSSFAFQTENELVVRSVLPTDLSTNVPLNTGIEIAFTEVIRDSKLGDYISISPEIAGRFEIYPDGKTAVFVPDKNLETNTVYTVSVKSGLTSASGKKLAEDYTAKFRTGVSEAIGSTNKLTIYTESTETVYSPSEFPTINYTLYNNNNITPKQNDVPVTVRRYSSAAEAIDAMKAYEAVRAEYIYSDENYYFPTAGLQKLADYNIKPVARDNYNNSYSSRMYFSLPQLEKGIYLVDYTVSGSWNGKEYAKDFQIMIQVTDLRVHTQSCDGETLFWVNTVAGEPVSGAAVTADCFNRVDLWNTEGGRAAYTTITGTTGSSGTMMINNGKNNAAYVKVSAGGEEIIVPLIANEDAVQKYFCKYLYTDREVYFSDDTVNYYGVITPGGEETMPARLYVYVGSIPYGTVTVGADGSFRGSLPIESYAGYSLYAKFCLADGTYVASKYIRVTQEDKPVYKASISFDKLFYVLGDTVSATVKASFFDGTPAPGLRFRIYSNGPFSYSGEQVIGSDGTVKITIKTSAYPQASSTYPMSIQLSAELMGYETTRLITYNSVLYFHSDVQLRSARINKDYSEIYLNKTDTSGIKTAADLTYPEFPENIYGDPAAGSVKILLYKCENVRVSAGTGYNPITKTTYQNYTTQTNETVVKSYSAEFVNGVIRLDHIEVEGFNGYYYYTVSYYDAKNGANYTMTVWAVKYDYQTPYNNIWYNYELMLDKEAYSVGDTVTVSYLYNKQPVSGKVLYTVYDSNGYALQKVNDGQTSFTFTFTDSMALYCTVYATVIGDSQYQYRSGFSQYQYRYASVAYDYTKNNSLNVEILPDSMSYTPGQKAAVRIKVTDKNVNPVTGNVLLGVVDEACFALGNQSISAVKDYFTSAGGSGVIPYYYAKYAYYDYYNGYYGRYTPPIVSVNIDGRFDIFREVAINNDSDSRNYYAAEAASPTDYASKAESGVLTDNTSGSGSTTGVYIRENFSDNPVFEAITLGSDGVAVFNFTVPDNITEWRLTALALGNMSAAKVTDRTLGSSVSDIICTQPYFINISSCDYYIEGDDITVLARSYGTALSGVSSVTYNADIVDAAGKSVGKLKVDGKTGETAWFNFGSLPTGTYSVTVTSSCGSYSDGVKVTFSVVGSGNIVDVRKDITIADIKNLAPLTYPLTLSFYNASYDKYLDVVNQTRRNYSGTRADAMAAYYVVLAASEKLFGSDGTGGLADIKDKLSTTGSGLIPLLDYSAGDIRLTAKICAIAPEALTEYRKADIISVLNTYVGGKSYTDDGELSAAYLGLAALGQPVLDSIYRVAGGSTNFSTEAKLYLAAAFAYIGDFSAANEMYTAVKSAYSAESEGGELYIKGGNTEESIKLTALALITAARLSRADAEKMVKYLNTHVSASEYYGLELAAYVKYFMPTEKVETNLSYRFGKDGEIQKIEIPAGGSYVLRLTKTGFDSLEIFSADEGIRVRAAYGGSPADALDGTVTTGELTVTKTITPYDAKSGLYMVTLNFSGKSDRTYASFNISDCIPTGARFVSSVNGSSNVSVSTGRYGSAWMYNTGKQQMKGYISVWTPYSTVWNERCSEYTFSGTVSYIIRGAVTGCFIAESALVRNVMTGNYAVSDRMYVTISDNEWVVKVIK